MDVKRQIVDKIEKYNKIIIVRHIRPDGDCIGASLGLRSILRNSYKDKEIVSLGKDKAHYLDFLGLEDEPKDEEYYKDALIIVVDTADEARISDDFYKLGKEIIKIDHHIIVNNYGVLNYVEEESSATSCLITKLWLANKDRLVMTDEAAKCLFTGIVTDSGRFKFSCCADDLFVCANELIKYNIDTEYIYSSLYLKEMKSIKLNAQLLKKVKFTENGVAYIHVTRRLRRKLGLTVEEASNSVSLMDSIKGCLIWIAFIDSEGEKSIRVRLRSRFVTVNQIAEKHHGGGHSMASGATAYSNKEIKEIVSEADLALKEYKENNKGWL